MNKFILVIILYLMAFDGQPAWGFNFQQVVKQAKALAKQPYHAPSDQQVPDFLKNLDYDHWRDIRFKNEKTLWGNDKNVSFKVRFFHPGFYYLWPVTINYVDENGVHPFIFSPDLFDYGKNDFQNKIPADLNFAGFRIHYPINTPHYDDEIAVFLGASYFRALPKDLVYGLSARGLAINTAVDSGEEFPLFKEFWIIKPEHNAKEITVFALLDSASVTGAYSYIIRPGEKTIMHVKSKLFVRQKIKRLGISPLTSMYLYGKNSKMENNNDFRPEVHDSDGLLILARSGEWIWRPLENPPRLLVNTFEVGIPKGFGLFQRDMNFDHYQDLEDRFDLHPSLWVVPHQDWGKGHVELVEIPSNSEHNDNIVAFWVPERTPEPGDQLSFSYTLEWCSSKIRLSSLGHVINTWVMPQPDKSGAQFIVDFQGNKIDAVPSGKSLSADISVNKDYKITEQQVIKNVVTNGWRLVFKAEFTQQGPLNNAVSVEKPAIDLRAFLKDGTQTLTETWTYTYEWPPRHT